MFNKMYSYISKRYGFSSALNNDRKKLIKEDLEDDMDETLFDAEGGSDHHPSIDLNVSVEQRLKKIEELYREEVTKQAFEELRLLRCEGCRRTSLAQNIYKDNIMRELLLGRVKKLQKKVDGKQQFDVVKKDHEDPKVLNVLNELTKNTNDIKNQMSFVERNTEKLNTKYGMLKTRIANLEKESMENSMKIIGLDYSHRTRCCGRGRQASGQLLYGLAKTASTEIRRTHIARNDRHYSDDSGRLYADSCRVVAGTQYFEATASASTGDFGPPPPPSLPPVTSAYGQPPPPMTTGTMTAQWNRLQATAAVSSSPAAAPEGTALKTYSRIVITEDVLKFVVLKPPVQRKTGNRILTEN